MCGRLKLYDRFWCYSEPKYKIKISAETIKTKKNKLLSYRRETALQGALVLAKSKRLELEDNILWTL